MSQRRHPQGWMAVWRLSGVWQGGVPATGGSFAGSIPMRRTSSVKYGTHGHPTCDFCKEGSPIDAPATCHELINRRFNSMLDCRVFLFWVGWRRHSQNVRVSSARPWGGAAVPVTSCRDVDVCQFLSLISRYLNGQTSSIRLVLACGLPTRI